jgi:antitoxin ParD1/3/4
MNVRLTPQQEEFVKQQVALGRYLSEVEVIREGLRLLADEMESRTDARRKIATGMEQLRAGQVAGGERVVAKVVRNLRKGRSRAKKA